jgi:hypothetical protein
MRRRRNTANRIERTPRHALIVRPPKARTPSRSTTASLGNPLTRSLDRVLIRRRTFDHRRSALGRAFRMRRRPALAVERIVAHALPVVVAIARTALASASLAPNRALALFRSRFCERAGERAVTDEALLRVGNSRTEDRNRESRDAHAREICPVSAKHFKEMIQWIHAPSKSPSDSP